MQQTEMLNSQKTVEKYVHVEFVLSSFEFPQFDEVEVVTTVLE